jgi:L-fucose isomerase-like protein
MNNIPSVKVALVAVSRDCFPIALSQTRRGKVAEACRKLGLSIVEIKATVENERDALAALDGVRSSGANALCVYLGNFGPEGPETILAQRFGGPVMFAAAAEESQADLMNGRGDAYCGMLNASYNLGLRKIKAYIPEYPVGIPEEVAAMVRDFVPVARALLGLSRLKTFGFGPRPFDFLASPSTSSP